MEKHLRGGSGIYFGGDPEFFFEVNGKIVGSERVIQGEAWKTSYSGKFIRDGVQAEFNLAPNPCRANLANSMKTAFNMVRENLASAKVPIKCCFRGIVDVEREELDSLSPESRVFGCMPSKNIYDEHATVDMNAANNPMRSAGGHIHLGLDAKLKEHLPLLVQVMDCVVGNTCVLIDRDPRAAERRLHYGRAGEYRAPNHGLEYRTLSNFWLRSYQLMSLVMGLSRLAVQIAHTSIYKPVPQIDYYSGKLVTAEPWNAAQELFEMIGDLNRVREAINTNDLKLAQENFEGVKKFLFLYTNTAYDQTSWGLWPQAFPDFEFFCKKVQEEGLEYWFPQDPLDHWCEIPEGHGTGWEAFLSTTVHMARIMGCTRRKIALARARDARGRFLRKES